VNQVYNLRDHPGHMIACANKLILNTKNTAQSFVPVATLIQI
jgi:hypothetical protein